MTKVTIYKNSENVCVGFDVVGHAGYAEEGEDIACAAISILVINTMNAIETYTDVTFSQEADGEVGSITYRIEDPTKETTLLLDTMVLGLQSLEDNELYTDYIDLIFEEV